MQKQLMGVAALGAALAVADAGSAQAVQWRVEDGGNGHWYQHVQTNLMTWDQCQALAESRGAHLASLTSAAEWQFTFGLTNGFHTVIGGYRGTQPGNLADGWQWVTGEPWSYTRWFGGEPNGCPGGVVCEGGLVVTESWCLQSQGSWNDSGREDVFGLSCGNPSYSLLEWSADCNEDGIVDKGQILEGQLQDDDSNGIPDICQQPTCRTADLFRDFNVNGADLGILLAQWGPSTSSTVADLNRDGVVDGIDLGLLLAFWGPCPG